MVIRVTREIGQKESEYFTLILCINIFQLEKQQKLNELDIVVTLQLHQIEHVVNGSLPSDLSKCLVFDAPGLSSLKHRIKELEQERIMQKKQQMLVEKECVK